MYCIILACVFFLSFFLPTRGMLERTHTHARTQQMKKTLKVFLLWGFVVCSVFIMCVCVCTYS